ncbi:putative Amastin surface glycoprotein [Leishmania utingensis]|uniref:Amastin surface glycoprotein n=1 Tax=Leishmania utingensis TaxID=653362 RepID=A0AAW3AZV0_9TRYP
MEWNIALLVYVILQLIAFLFVLVATPLDMFCVKNENMTKNCITFWGFKDMCSGVSHNATVDILWAECTGHLMRFRTAQALAIVTIVLYGSAFALGVVIIFCCSWLRFVCVALNIVGAITLGVVWGLMVVTYRTDDSRDCVRESFLSNYGAGFVLFVIAWVLDILNIFVLLLPFHITVFRELDGANDKSEKTSKGESEERSTQQEDEEYE